jgi:anthranilate phosphoribosyltransferase
VLKNLGSIHACVVHGRDGMDEVTTCAETVVTELVHDSLRTYTVKPEDFGLRRSSLDELKVPGPAESARVIRDVLAAKEGPPLDIVLLNAAAGLTVAGRVANLDAGLKLAAGVIDSGAAAKTLARVVELSHAKG